MSAAGKEDQALSARFEDALVFSTRLHAKQKRKNSDTPYVAHLLGVTALVLEDGGDEDEAIAALLHDAVEDQGGLKTLSEIRKRYGERVADIVDAVTDSYSVPKPPWRERKEQYINSIRTANASVIRVSLADKVYNASATLRDIRREGDNGWARFNGGKEGTLWYYRQLIRAFNEFVSNYLLRELMRIYEELEDVAKNEREVSEY